MMTLVPCKPLCLLHQKHIVAHTHARVPACVSNFLNAFILLLLVAISFVLCLLFYLIPSGVPYEGENFYKHVIEKVFTFIGKQLGDSAFTLL